MDLSIVLASYKEGENLKILLPKIHNVMKKVGMTYEILIIDALNVLDDSPNVCAEFSATYINGGDSYGDAIRCGINAANGQKLLIMDADGSHEAAEFIQAIENRAGIQVAALEEIAFYNGWINKEQLLKSAKQYGKAPYGKYLRKVAEGKILKD